MARDINPAYEAYLRAKESGLYDEASLKQMLSNLEIDEASLEPTREVGAVEGTKPVTTLKTIEDEEMSLEAPGGPIATTKQREVIANIARQIEEKERKA